MRKSKGLFIEGLLVLSMLFITCNGTSKEKAISTQIDDVRIAINISANYLVKNTKADGTFEYRINLNPAINVKKKYNILRHAERCMQCLCIINYNQMAICGLL